jgi:hypothetical protein
MWVVEFLTQEYNIIESVAREFAILVSFGISEGG